MRAFPALVLALTGAALCTGALAQDRRDTPSAPAPSATTGAAPSGVVAPATQPPLGHRQPTAANAPSAAPVSPYDQQIDRNLDICKGC